MERLTFVDENGKVLFTPRNCGADTGYTIYQLVQYSYTGLLNDIAHRLANYEQRLQGYEDLEEQGKLLKLPCAVGDVVYVLAECEHIEPQLDGTLYDSNGGMGTATGYHCPYEDNCPFDDEAFEGCGKYRNQAAVFEDTVKSITIEEDGIYVSTDNCGVCSEVGRYVFLTRKEAETALQKGMKV